MTGGARRIVAALWAAVALGACDGGPEAGDVVFDLVAPAAQTGALTFYLSADAPLAIEAVSPACAACRVFVTAVSDQDVRGVVTGPVAPGPLLRVTVSDVQRPEAYAGRVSHVAGVDFRLLSVAGYALRVAR